jgi:hypothetical protein
MNKRFGAGLLGLVLTAAVVPASFLKDVSGLFRFLSVASSHSGCVHADTYGKDFS